MTAQVAEQAFVDVSVCELLGKYTLRKECGSRPGILLLLCVWSWPLCLGVALPILLLLFLIAMLLSKADPGA